MDNYEDCVIAYSYSNKDKKWKVEVLNQDNELLDTRFAITEDRALDLARRIAKKYNALRIYKQKN